MTGCRNRSRGKGIQPTQTYTADQPFWFIATIYRFYIFLLPKTKKHEKLAFHFVDQHWYFLNCM